LKAAVIAVQFGRTGFLTFAEGPLMVQRKAAPTDDFGSAFVKCRLTLASALRKQIGFVTWDAWLENVEKKIVAGRSGEDQQFRSGAARRYRRPRGGVSV
jgi:hypothetical protein